MRLTEEIVRKIFKTFKNVSQQFIPKTLLQLMDRHFYHSFPRIRPDDKRTKLIEDGLEILKSIDKAD